MKLSDTENTYKLQISLLLQPIFPLVFTSLAKHKIIARYDSPYITNILKQTI